MAGKTKARRRAACVFTQALGLKNTALATAASAVLAAGSLARSVKEKATSVGSVVLQKPQGYFAQQQKTSGGVITMKKSTLVWLLVALAAVAGFLAALYVYVLRREKELDEYEQLLFSEEFNDDLPDDEEEPEPAPVAAE